MTRDDFFWSNVERGDTADQIVTQAASWELNPAISEELTRKLAPSVAIFDREYRAIPSAARSAAFDPDAIERAFKHPRPAGINCQRRVILDPSSGKKDAFTMAAVGWVVPPKELPPVDGSPKKGPAFRPYLRVYAVDSLGESFWDRTSGDEIADNIAEFAKKFRCEHVHSDQREELFLRSAIQKRRLSFISHPWTAQSKPLAVERVRRGLADETLDICTHDRFRRELLSFEEKINASGAFTYGARGGKHDDYVALLITAALAELEGYLTPHPPVDWARMNQAEPNAVIDSRDMSGYDGRHGARSGPREAPHYADVREVPVSYQPASANGPATWSFGFGARKPGAGGGGGSGGSGGDFGDYG